MRPKYVLWTLVAVVWSIWYALDPQARLTDTEVRAVDPGPGQTLLGAHMQVSGSTGSVLAEVETGISLDSRIR